MKTQLYALKDEIMVLDEVKEWYYEKNNSDIPIQDGVMELIIHTDLSDEINVICDDLLNWCNDYAELTEAARYLSKTEMAASIKDIYIGVHNQDKHILDSVNENIKYGIDENDYDFVVLNTRLMKIESNIKAATKKRGGR